MNKSAKKKNFRRTSSRVEKNNYQDRAEKREFKKGEKFEQNYLADRNDPSWYAKNIQIMNDFASFSFGYPTGSPFRIDRILAESSAQTLNISSSMQTVPGICVMRLALSPGLSTSFESAINVAANNLYAKINYKNSRNKSYNSPDLMMYILAMDNLYANWNWQKRLYGICSQYNAENRYIARALVEANGVDFDNLIANLPNYRGFLNTMAARITAFCVPAVFTYNVRHSWLFSNVFKDADNSKAQYYMYVPDYFYQYDETSSPHGGVLTPVVCPGFAASSVGSPVNNGQLWSVDQLEQLLINQFNALQYSEDINVMSTDILMAYGEANLFKISSIDPDFTIAATYSQEVLSQIENADIVTRDGGQSVPVAPDTTFQIKQDPNLNIITFNPTLSNENVDIFDGKAINMHKTDITPSDVMVASRLVCGTQITTSGTYFTSVGSEWVTRVSLIYMSNMSDTYSSVATYKNLVPYAIIYPGKITLNVVAGEELGDLLTSAFEVISIATKGTAFDWVPIVPITVYDHSTGKNSETVVGFVADWDRYTILSQDNVDNMNLAALLSEFNVPEGSSF